MRIPRTGPALICAFVLAGCQRTEKPADATAPPPPRVDHPQAVSIDWFATVPRLERVPQRELEHLPPEFNPPRNKAKADPDSAISAFLAANGGFIPETGEELAAALKTAGDFAHLPISFSSVAMDSGLAKPRVVFAGMPSEAANRPSFHGRLFLAANIGESERPFAPPKLATIEFISWNSRRLKFDFGVIEPDDPEPVKFLDGVRCFACHKSRGPILGVAPWSNTMHNTTVTMATETRLGFERNAPVFAAGLPLANADAAKVDASVRVAEEFLVERRTVQALAKSKAGRTALLQIMAALAQPGPIASLEPRTHRLLSDSDMRRFVYDAFQIQKSAASSKLHDLSPDGMMGPELGRVPSWGGVSPAQLLAFDAVRSRGDHRLGERHVPSNPTAFVKRPAVPYMATAAITPALVARAIGLTAGDRRFLAEALSEAATLVSKRSGRTVALRDLAEKSLADPRFQEMIEAGVVPDRDEFKDRFADGLAVVLRDHGHFGALWNDRERYASMPAIATRTEREESVVLPTTACMGCHDVAKPNEKRSFNPIPALPFDPLDAGSREAWSKANANRGKDSLARMFNRLKKDMPPVDSAEHAMFREKNPETFRVAAEFLERELSRR